MAEKIAGPRPSVAVIVVNYNAGALLERCLSALAAQTWRPAHTYVVDNASSDDSCQRVALDFPQAHLIRLGENTGFAAANNLAVRRAEDCEWIALLNPDAFPEPGWLEALLAAAAGNPEYASFSSRMLMADRPEVIDGVGDVYHASGLHWREGHGQRAAGNHLQPREVFSACAAAALHRRSAFMEAGGFDEAFFCYAEDVDLGYRLRLLGHRCLYVPEAVVLHQGSALSGRGSAFSIYHGHRNLVWTYLKNVPSPWFWWYLPQHVALNLLTPFFLIGKGGFWTAVRAKLAALSRLPDMLRKRRAIQPRARVGYRTIRPFVATGIRAVMGRRRSA